jgi:SHS2 domain-containing protein
MTKKEFAGYQEIEHTADWALRVWAPDLAGLLEQAARGMYELSGTRISGSGREKRSLKIESTDAEGLLVNFLSELLHFLDQENIAFDEFDLVVSETEANVNLAGALVIERKKEIKAVTYHNLLIEKKSQGLEAQIVFDV